MESHNGYLLFLFLFFIALICFSHMDLVMVSTQQEINTQHESWYTPPDVIGNC